MCCHSVAQFASLPLGGFEMNKRYFLTVDWCNKGHRGIFSGMCGNAFPKDDRPHTQDEIWDILDCFSMILSPESLEFAEDELSKYNKWYPLAEFSNQYGIAVEGGVKMISIFPLPIIETN